MVKSTEKMIFWTLSKLDKIGTIDQRRLILDEVWSDEEKDVFDTF